MTFALRPRTVFAGSPLSVDIFAPATAPDIAACSAACASQPACGAFYFCDQQSGCEIDSLGSPMPFAACQLLQPSEALSIGIFHLASGGDRLGTSGAWAGVGGGRGSGALKRPACSSPASKQLQGDCACCRALEPIPVLQRARKQL